MSLVWVQKKLQRGKEVVERYLSKGGDKRSAPAYELQKPATVGIPTYPPALPDSGIEPMHPESLFPLVLCILMVHTCFCNRDLMNGGVRLDGHHFAPPA